MNVEEFKPYECQYTDDLQKISELIENGWEYVCTGFGQLFFRRKRISESDKIKQRLFGIFP